MAARSTVTTHDLRRLLDLGDPCRLDDGGDPLPRSVLDDLAALVGCDDLSYLVQDPTSRQVFTDQSLLPAPSLAACDAEAIDDWYWQHFWACQCSYPERSGDYTTVTRASDFESPRQFARGPLAGLLRMLGVRYEIMVPLPPRGRIDHRILLFRSDGRDFTERERLLLSLARPQLATLHETLLRRLAGEPELTTRQWELLRLVAAGLTNRQVGRCLHISEATVRKHLENIYQRLQVTSRSAAVARAFPTVVAADRQPMPWGLRE